MTDDRKSSRPETGLSRRRFLEATAAFSPLPLIGPSGVDPLLVQGTDGLPLGTVGQPRSLSAIGKSLRRLAAQTTLFDTHEHLWREPERLAKKLDCFLLFSHYTDDDLISAGMAPNAA